MKKTISKGRAQGIAAHWHNGQWSALYSFCSTGEFFLEHALQYFKEIYSDIEAEYFSAREVNRTQKEIRELNQLKNYLLKVAERDHGLIIEFHKDQKYGYTVPYLADGVSEDVEAKIKPVSYLA